MKMGEPSGHDSIRGLMVNYMLNNQQQEHANNNNYIMPSGLCSATSLDRLSFADVMQFADFGPKLSLNHNCNNHFGGEENDNATIDPVYFLKFPVLNDSQHHEHPVAATSQQIGGGNESLLEERDEQVGISENNSSNPLQLEFLGENTNNNNVNHHKSTPSSTTIEAKSKRKRPRTTKTSEEVESQRMTHIAVERNRRKQMNEHLGVLRSLMPNTYVQRGDQASIIGGAIEFVRELEQLLQCLESQKRRRLYGDGVGGRGIGEPSVVLPCIQQPQPSIFGPSSVNPADVDLDTGLREETAESKSCIADVEVKLLGFDALIKILSRRRPGQLIRAIAALEDLQFTILHTNITTIEQTVLYSFNVKVASESRFMAEDIASSVQQIFTFIHTNNSFNDGISIAHSDISPTCSADQITNVHNMPGYIVQPDSLRYPTKVYSIELKLLFSAFQWKTLAMTTLGSF
ncbi:hypothetical protein Nepgr_015252 [Nepenthes gracilis]|uniref:BHLH domain-containing protein n=1 Tax=Nepenthes gracilis TaxID=150966 RepID=A0AAD3XR48_NEPGR|nr:hypothetical protein Nepgr_015252 [Nepenthes gracilis]